MVFRQSETHPLRMYIEVNSGESAKTLATFLHDKYFYKNPYKEAQKKPYNNDTEDELDQLIFFTEDDQAYFPSGIVSIVKDAALKLGYHVDVVYLESYEALLDDIEVPDDLIDGITLRDYQVGAVKAALVYKRGLIRAATGSGKTNIMISVAKYLHAKETFNIIMCVPTTYLLHQTYENAIRAGVSEKDLCKYGDGNEIDPTKRIVVATVQTLYRRISSGDQMLSSWIENVGCLLFDEVQHISSKSWYTVADNLQPEYLLGFSAEPFYGDREHQIRDLLSRGTLGSILYTITMKELVEMGYLSKPYVIAMDSRYKGNIYTLVNWHSVNKAGIVDNYLRNSQIIEVADMMIQLKKNPLILVQQIRHGDALAKQLSVKNYKVAFITGGSNVKVYSGGMVTDEFKDDKEIVKKQFTEGLIDAIFGTSTLDEGVDMPVISSVILAGGGKVSIRLIQRIGRGLRVKKGDNTTFIVDFQDRFNVVLKKHFSVRKSTYDKNSIPIYLAQDINQAAGIVMNLRENPGEP